MVSGTAWVRGRLVRRSQGVLRVPIFWICRLLNPGGSTARCCRGVPARKLLAVAERWRWRLAGGIEDADRSPEGAVHRELAEELGAKALVASQVFLHSSPSDSGVAAQHFFAARLIAINEAQRSGPEFADPSRGGYDVDRVELLGDELAGVDLKPGALKEFIMANREALLDC